MERRLGMEEPKVRIVGPEIRKFDGYLRDVVGSGGWKVSVVLTHVETHSYSFVFTVGVTNMEDVKSDPK